jgi:hypothetical protein
MKSENFHFRRDVDEVIILKKANGGFKVETKCYRTAPGR